MPTLSVRLTEDQDRRLADEARRAGTKRSELARNVLADYVRRRERERFMAEMEGAARFLARHPAETAGISEDFAALDDQALDLVDEPPRQGPRRLRRRTGEAR